MTCAHHLNTLPHLLPQSIARNPNSITMKGDYPFEGRDTPMLKALLQLLARLFGGGESKEPTEVNCGFTGHARSPATSVHMIPCHWSPQLNKFTDSPRTPHQPSMHKSTADEFSIQSEGFKATVRSETRHGQFAFRSRHTIRTTVATRTEAQLISRDGTQRPIIREGCIATSGFMVTDR